jgi:hypothetical protein
MKIILTLSVLCCLSAAAFAQKSFEGLVTYNVSYKSKMPQLTDEQMTRLGGTTQLYYTKGDNYKYIWNGKLFEWAIYSGRDKKVYSKFSTVDSILWYSVELSHDTIYKTELKENDTTILGYPCNRLTFTCKTGSQVYYFSPALAVDPDLYTDYKVVNYYDYLRIAKAVALKEIFVTNEAETVITARDIQQQPVDDRIFEIPKEYPLRDNPLPTP